MIHCSAVCLSSRILLNIQEPKEFDDAGSVPNCQISETEPSILPRCCDLFPCNTGDIFTLESSFPEECIAHFIYEADTFFRRGSQFAIESFLVFRGRPRYLIGKVPAGMPQVSVIASISTSERPLEKKHDFSTLIDSPEKALNSSRTWRIICIELREPSVKTRMSSAKHKWAKQVGR